MPVRAHSDPTPGAATRVPIAVAVIPDAAGERVLLARRPDHVRHGGLWEFPGGKQEPGEDIPAALARELREELDLEVASARPLLRIPHDYPSLSVELHVWIVDRWNGKPRGMEGQALEWVPVNALAQRAFPEANLGIVTALQLPEVMAVTPDLPHYEAEFETAARRLLASGTGIVQFRSRRADTRARTVALARLAPLCHAAGARLLVNGTVAEMHACGARGLHLPADRLMALERRPLPPPFLVGASCHDERELAHAEALGVDLALLGPVQPTTSHPGAPVLGWERFRDLLRGGRRMPVYGIGGLVPADLDRARRAGARGIAMIGSLWGRPDAPPVDQ